MDVEYLPRFLWLKMLLIFSCSRFCYQNDQNLPAKLGTISVPSSQNTSKLKYFGSRAKKSKNS